MNIETLEGSTKSFQWQEYINTESKINFQSKFDPFKIREMKHLLKVKMMAI